MVEFEEANICFAAINTRVVGKVNTQSNFILNEYLILANTSAILIYLLVFLIVEPTKFCLTILATRLTNTKMFVLPTKIFLCISLFAAA